MNNPEIILVAETLLLQTNKHAGTLNPGSLAQLEKNAPKLYKEFIEDATAIVDALLQFRTEKQDHK